MADTERTHSRPPAPPRGRPWERLRLDRRHGATELQQEALRSLSSLTRARTPRLSAQELRWLKRWVRGMRGAQPAMGAVRGMAEEVDRWRRTEGPHPQREGLRALLQGLAQRSRKEGRELNLFARRRFPHVRTVITFSRSSVVRGVLLGLRSSKRPARVLVSRSTPGNEGIELAAELRRRLPHVVEVEDRVAFTSVDRRSVLLLGADTLYSDGTLVHKVGTRALARQAHRRGARVVVLAPSSRILSTRAPRRLRLPSLFDATPARYIDEVWTDRGAWRPKTGAGASPGRAVRPSRPRVPTDRKGSRRS